MKRRIAAAILAAGIVIGGVTGCNSHTHNVGYVDTVEYGYYDHGTYYTYPTPIHTHVSRSYINSHRNLFSSSYAHTHVHVKTTTTTRTHTNPVTGRKTTRTTKTTKVYRHH